MKHLTWARPWLEALDDADDSGLFLAIYLAVMLLTLAGIWATFVKAGQRGWTSVIPVVNLIIGLRIVGKSFWWIFLVCLPVVNIFMAVWLARRLAVRFGRGLGFSLGLVFLPGLFFPWLGFGKSQYILPEKSLSQFGPSQPSGDQGRLAA